MPHRGAEVILFRLVRREPREAHAAALVALLLGACASRETPLALPAGHPADPSATGAAASSAAPAETPRATPPAPPAAQSYVCPMHPEVTSSAPGECPKCGMGLVPVKPKPVQR